MNRTLRLALLFPVLAVPSLATTDPVGDWGNLDKNLKDYAAVKGAPGGPEIGALIRSSIDFSSDEGFQIGNEDLQGVRLQDARVFLQGDVGDYFWRLSFNFASSNGEPTGSASDGVDLGFLEDAYGRAKINDNLHFTMGQFLCPPLHSTQVSEGRLLFIDRTVLARRFEAWQPGIALDGDYEQFHFKIALQNGLDGASEDYGTTIRGEYRIGNGAYSCEGALGAADDLNMTIGASWFDEGELDKGGMIAFDAGLTWHRFSAFAEMADLDDDLAGMAFATPSGNTPWSLTGSYLFAGDQWEVAGRYQDLDDDNDTKVISGGLNYYQQGHAAKWQVNVSDWDSDAPDGTLIQVGLTLGADS